MIMTKVGGAFTASGKLFHSSKFVLPHDVVGVLKSQNYIQYNCYDVLSSDPLFFAVSVMLMKLQNYVMLKNHHYT